MKKNANAVVVVGRKQQVSKILLGQIERELKDRTCADSKYIHIDGEPITGRGIEMIINGTTNGFGTCGKFRFTFHKKVIHGKVYMQVCYINNNGLQSVVYNRDEWNLIVDTIAEMRDEYLSRYESRMEAIRKTQEEEQFQHRVAAEVARQLDKRLSKMNRAKVKPEQRDDVIHVKINDICMTDKFRETAQ